MSVSDESGRPGPTTRLPVAKYGGVRVARRSDHVVTEEPLEVRLRAPGQPAVAVGVTMRTPGHDVELALGLMFGEGLIRHSADVVRAAHCTDADVAVEHRFNILTIDLAGPLPALPTARALSATSACGVCGTATLDALQARQHIQLSPSPTSLDSVVLAALPLHMHGQQRLFSRTGGSHAAAVFTSDGTLVTSAEDIGRHNAVDKVIGRLFLDNELPGTDLVLVVSSRAGYEIVAKALVAGISAVVCVSAASSLAVTAATSHGMLLAGFARDGRMTLYSGADRLAAPKLG